VREQIEAVTIDGRALRVSVREPLRVEQHVLALATALRVFQRYPVFDELTLVVGRSETRLSRQEIERLLGPKGWRAVLERRRWPQTLARVVQSFVELARAEEGTR
jgi:hypothetical protein